MRRKDELIAKILSNPSYAEDSDVYRMLAEDLALMREDALENLAALLAVKMGAAPVPSLPTHAGLPWRPTPDGFGVLAKFAGPIDADDSEAMPIAHLGEGKRRKANLRFILKACNMHARLYAYVRKTEEQLAAASKKPNVVDDIRAELHMLLRDADLYDTMELP